MVVFQPADVDFRPIGPTQFLALALSVTLLNTPGRALQVFKTIRAAFDSQARGRRIDLNSWPVIAN